MSTEDNVITISFLPEHKDIILQAVRQMGAPEAQKYFIESGWHESYVKVMIRRAIKSKWFKGQLNG